MIEHAALEPRSALVQPIDGTYHIYSGHQGGAVLIQFIANVLGVAEDNVVYHPHQIGGALAIRFTRTKLFWQPRHAKKWGFPSKSS